MNLKIKTLRGNPERNWRKIFQRRGQVHDPMLVFNMSIFNSPNGWERIFNPLKAHENGVR
jgi:hypothetical protein